jgi:hypothetical protein
MTPSSSGPSWKIHFMGPVAPCTISDPHLHVAFGDRSRATNGEFGVTTYLVEPFEKKKLLAAISKAMEHYENQPSKVIAAGN